MTTGKVEYKFLSLHDTDNSGICAEDSTLKHINNGIENTSPIPLNTMYGCQLFVMHVPLLIGPVF